MLFVRLVASPTLPPSASDALHRRFASEGKLLACINDPDVNATLVSLKVADEELRPTVAAMAETIGGAHAVGRAFRVEIQHPDAQKSISDESLRAVAVDVQGALRASVHLARRTVPAGPWAAARPMGWGPDGLVLGDTAPALPFGGSESSGVAVEAGPPTVITKAKVVGSVSAAQLKSIAAATGGSASGLVEVGAYPIAIARDGTGVFILELSDVKRTPLHRALAVMEIEARRTGARLGLGAILSDAPLELFLGALSTHMGLHVAREQVVETHLAGGTAPG